MDWTLHSECIRIEFWFTGRANPCDFLLESSPQTSFFLFHLRLPHPTPGWPLLAGLTQRKVIWIKSSPKNRQFDRLWRVLGAFGIWRGRILNSKVVNWINLLSMQCFRIRLTQCLASGTLCWSMNGEYKAEKFPWWGVCIHPRDLSLKGSLKRSFFCCHLGLSLLSFTPEWEKHYLKPSHTKQEGRLVN